MLTPPVLCSAEVLGEDRPVEQSQPTIEKQLEDAGQRLATALERIAQASNRESEKTSDSGQADAEVSAALDAMQSKIDALEAENRKLRETGKAVADGIDETIQALRSARA